MIYLKSRLKKILICFTSTFRTRVVYRLIHCDELKLDATVEDDALYYHSEDRCVRMFITALLSLCYVKKKNKFSKSVLL